MAKEVPSNEAIVRRFAEAIAKSPMDIKPGEAVVLDRRGVPLGRRRFKRLVWAWQFGMIGSAIAGGVLVFSGALLPGEPAGRLAADAERVPGAAAG